MKILVIADDEGGNIDEGMRNASLSIISNFNKKINSNSAIKLNINKIIDKIYLGENSRILNKYKNIDFAIYIPYCSTTFASILRAWRISRILNCKISVVSLQHKEINFFPNFIKQIKPYHIFYQEKVTHDYFSTLGAKTDFLPSGVDLLKFGIINQQKKIELRKKYGFPLDDKIILHVGHLNPGRGIEELAGFAQNGFTPVLVASTSTPQNQELAISLKNKGVRIITDFVPNIQEIYQLSDIYIFPTEKSGCAIGCPLSVLEAMACNLKVLSTSFGGLPTMLKEGEGLVFYKDSHELLNKIDYLISSNNVNTREKVIDYSWDKIVDYIVNKVNQIHLT